MKGLAAGIARVDITPPLGLVHAGWGDRTHQRVIGIDLPLWATALALSDGDQTVVIVDIDHVGLREQDAFKTRQAMAELTGLPLSHVRLSYTHTHSVARRDTLIYRGRGTEMLEPYRDNLMHQIEGVAWSAANSLRPVRVKADRGRCRISVNRRLHRPDEGVILGRNWDGPVDDEVQVIRIDAIEGEPLATVVAYSCHGVTVGPDCDLITPDYPGVAKRAVEEATGSTCLFLQGTAGDINPIRGVARGGINEYKRLGSILGHEAARVWWEMEVPSRRERYLGILESGGPIALYADEPVEGPDAKLRIGTRRIPLPLKEFPDPETLEESLKEQVRRVRELLAAGDSEDSIGRAAALCRRTSNQASLARAVHGQTHVTWELQGFVIGQEIALVAMPGEPFVEIGLRVKQESPFEYTVVSGYSNSGWGYIPTADAYSAGGYEVEFATPFSSGAADSIVQGTLALLHELAT
jgi:neutral ceramidase